MTAHPPLGRDKENKGLHSAPTDGIPTNVREGGKHREKGQAGAPPDPLNRAGLSSPFPTPDKAVVTPNQLLHCPAPGGLWGTKGVCPCPVPPHESDPSAPSTYLGDCPCAHEL